MYTAFNKAHIIFLVFANASLVLNYDIFLTYVEKAIGFAV